jgi:hypothetical protein
MDNLSNLPLKLIKGDIWDLCHWEKILDQGLEKRQVIFQKFGYVTVSHGSDQHDILV